MGEFLICCGKLFQSLGAVWWTCSSGMYLKQTIDIPIHILAHEGHVLVSHILKYVLLIILNLSTIVLYVHMCVTRHPTFRATTIQAHNKTWCQKWENRWCRTFYPSYVNQWDSVLMFHKSIMKETAVTSKLYLSIFLTAY